MNTIDINTKLSFKQLTHIAGHFLQFVKYEGISVNVR